MQKEKAENCHQKIVRPSFVDLGLPSGNLWATSNLGAGDLYAIGERYTVDEIQNLLISEENVFLPTKEDIEELLEYTDRQWSCSTHYTDEGCKVEGGIRFMSMENGKQLYFPSCSWSTNICGKDKDLPYGFYLANPEIDGCGELAFYKNTRNTFCSWRKSDHGIMLPVRLIANS